jgi:hypothetical protein
MTTIRYETDVAAWANEQAKLIRNGQFEQLDLEHIAEEIEDVGKSVGASVEVVQNSRRKTGPFGARGYG